MPELAPAEEKTVGALNQLVALERDMIAALEAARGRLPGEDRGQLDQLLADHAGRLPVLEDQVRELGGRPPDPGQQAELPHDAAHIATVGDDREAVRALADDHEALADAYREALALPGGDEDVRHTLEQFASEMEQHGAQLAALLPAV
jgi:DNA-binding ferritin-like protein